MEASAEFAEFVRSRGDALHRYGYVLTGSLHDAADLVQETLIRLGNVWTKVESPEQYARITMARMHISFWRRRRREQLFANAPEQARDDMDLARFDGDTGLWRLLAELPPRQRAVLVLRYYEDLSDHEIAAILGISRGTVRSQAARALDKLKQYMPIGEAGRA